MKELLKSLPIVGRAFKAAGEWRLRRHRWKADPARRLEARLRGRENLSVVQIGSNDGVTGDPIRQLLQWHPSWRALLVEPVPFLFERLRGNYAGRQNVRFENVAIAAEIGSMSFYYVDPTAKQRFPGLPEWFDQLGSFDRGNITRNLGPEVESFIVSTQVATLPLAAVLARNDVTAIDLLHIDTEGADWTILQQLDRRAFRPEVILFEHKNLSPSDRRAATEFLTEDYRLTEFDLTGDSLCERI